MDVWIRCGLNGRRRRAANVQLRVELLGLDRPFVEDDRAGGVRSGLVGG